MATTASGLHIEFPDVMDLRIASLYLNMSEGRLRALVRESKVKGAQEDKKWIFTRADLDIYNAAPKTRAVGSKSAKAGKAFLIHVTAAQLQAVKNALAAAGVELEQRYDYAKQHAYQAKRRAEKAAAKANGTAKPVAAKAAVPAQVK